MAMLRWSAAEALAWGLLNVAAPSGLAKPPDLPVDQNVTCPEARERPPQGSYSLKVDLIGGEIRVEVEAAPAADVPACVDAVCPVFVPALVEHVRRQLAQAQPAPGTPVPAAPAADPAGREAQARQMFRVAERCRVSGDLDMARSCYQETHLLSPTSRCGRLAMQRLHDLERHQAGRGDAEESDAPPAPKRGPTTDEPPVSKRRDANGSAPAERQARKLHRQPQPLGLVERSY